MPLFDTQIPVVKNFDATQPSPTFSGHEETIMKLLGYKDDGTRNTWGKIMPFTPFGGAATIGGNLLANQMVKDNDPALQEAVHQANKEKIQGALAMLQIGAGVGATAFGAPQAGVPLITSGVNQGIKTFANGGEMEHGGSHESGNDFAVVHKQTGEDTGIRLENGEVVFSEDRSELMKDAVESGNKDLLMKIVEQQLRVNNKGKEMANGTNYVNVSQQENDPYAFGSFYGQPKGQPIFDTYPAPQNQPYVFQGQQTPSTPMYGSPNTWGAWNSSEVPQQMSASTPSATGSGMEYLSYLPGLLQTVTGLAGASKELPKGFTPTQDWTDYYNQAKEQSTQGFTPEEKIMYQHDILGNYNLGLDKLTKYSGGNSAAVLAGLNELGQGKNDAELKLAAMDKQQKRANLSNYASALDKDLAMQQIMQDKVLEMAMKNRAAASGLANTGLGNLENTYQYQQNYGKGSPYYNAMLENIKRGQIQNK